MSLTSFWSPYCYVQTQFTSCFSVFSVPIVDFEQIKSSWVVRVTFPKNRDITLLLLVKNVWFIAVRDELRICDRSKIDLFPKIIYSLKSLTFLTRSSILRSFTGSWICLGYFFRFKFSIDLFISPSIFKN